jgi:WD40 repeat protein
MRSLIDNHCLNLHTGAITASYSHPQYIATGAEDGSVIVRSHSGSFRREFHREGQITGLCIPSTGECIAVVDEAGSVAVYNLKSGEIIFVQPGKPSRSFLSVSINHTQTKIAALGTDGVLRCWELPSQVRDINWPEHMGQTLQFDNRGERILILTDQGQPRLYDLKRPATLEFEYVNTHMEHALLIHNNAKVLLGGPYGLVILDTNSRMILTRSTSEQSSGIIGIAVSPKEDRVAALTHRSVHLFSLPDLQPLESYKHKVPDVQNTIVWTPRSLYVGGPTGQLHSRNDDAPCPPIDKSTAIGQFRIATHSDFFYIWKNNNRVGGMKLPHQPKVVSINRSGSLIVVSYMFAPVQVYDAKSGELIMNAHESTINPEAVFVGSTHPIILVQQANGGCKWWNLNTQQGFALNWTVTSTLTSGGTWMGVVTPSGEIQILDPSTGKPCMPNPEKPFAIPKQLCFVNRSPTLLVYDSEGVLSRYDLLPSIEDDIPASADDIVQITRNIDKIWGITGGKYCAMRINESDHFDYLWVPLDGEREPHTVNNLVLGSSIDIEHGSIVSPAKGEAILEMDAFGNDDIVYRSLSQSEWIAFNNKTVLAKSKNALRLTGQ